MQEVSSREAVQVGTGGALPPGGQRQGPAQAEW